MGLPLDLYNYIYLTNVAKVDECILIISCQIWWEWRLSYGTQHTGLLDHSHSQSAYRLQCWECPSAKFCQGIGDSEHEKRENETAQWNFTCGSILWFSIKWNILPFVLHRFTTIYTRFLLLWFLIRWLLISTKTCSKSWPHVEIISVVNGGFSLGSYNCFTQAILTITVKTIEQIGQKKHPPLMTWLFFSMVFAVFGCGFLRQFGRLKGHIISDLFKLQVLPQPWRRYLQQILMYDEESSKKKTMRWLFQMLFFLKCSTWNTWGRWMEDESILDEKKLAGTIWETMFLPYTSMLFFLLTHDGFHMGTFRMTFVWLFYRQFIFHIGQPFICRR